MITGELKSKIDHIWETFWTGGLANPLSVIEQVTYLLFIKLLDGNLIKKDINPFKRGHDSRDSYGLFFKDTSFMNGRSVFDF